jgi:hypothetical protein
VERLPRKNLSDASAGHDTAETESTVELLTVGPVPPWNLVWDLE